MSTTEEPRVHYRTTSTGPTVPDYRPLVEVGPGRMITPAACTVHVEVTGEPGLAHVTMNLELIERRYRITRMEATPPAGAGLDVEAIRRLTLPKFARHGIQHLIVFESTDGERYTAERPMENPDPLWRVALAYSTAYAFGEDPTAAVATDEQISHAAAAQRVKRAREAGYLPPTERGKAS